MEDLLVYTKEQVKAMEAELRRRMLIERLVRDARAYIEKLYERRADDA